MLLWIFRTFFAIAILGVATAVATSKDIPDKPHLYVQLAVIVVGGVSVVALDMGALLAGSDTWEVS